LLLCIKSKIAVSPLQFVTQHFISCDYILKHSGKGRDCTWIRQLQLPSRYLTVRIFGPKRNEVTGEWRKLHNEELNDLYSSPNTVRVIKSRMRWAGHVAHMGKRRGVYRVWWVNLRERDRLGDQGVDGRIILRWIFRKWHVEGMDWIELVQDRDRWRALVNAVINLRVP